MPEFLLHDDGSDEDDSFESFGKEHSFTQYLDEEKERRRLILEEPKYDPKPSSVLGSDWGDISFLNVSKNKLKYNSKSNILTFIRKSTSNLDKKSESIEKQS